MMSHYALNFVLFAFKSDTTIPSVTCYNNHAKILFASCAKPQIKCCRFLHVTVTWRFG